ncbi:MAG: hypothetical protein AB7O67_00575 [Vicinamibacterales bacterium]
MPAHAVDLPRALPLLLPLLLVASGATAGESSDAHLDPRIPRLVAALDTAEVDVTATRLLKAATRSGGHAAWLRARTERHGADVRIDVLEEHGSGRTRKRVLHGVLDAERESDRQRRSAITSANYDFRIEQEGPDGYAVRLLPKRRDTRLVDGVIWVDADGHPRRLQGRLAKSPSFWVRSVTILTTYDQVNGVTLPVSVETLADVRFIGLSVFSMRYTYESVDRDAVRSAVRAADAGPEPATPSPTILALHAAWKSGTR